MPMFLAQVFKVIGYYCFALVFEFCLAECFSGGVLWLKRYKR